MAARKTKRPRKTARSEKPDTRFVAADPPARNRTLLALSIILLAGWLGVLAWIVARIV